MIEVVQDAREIARRVPIAVLVIDQSRATKYKFAGPWTQLELWPWTGTDDHQNGR
jgi:hypothetical protein